MAFLNFITRRAFFGRHSAARSIYGHHGGNRTFDHFGSVLQATFDDQRLIFDLENLLGIGHLRQTELLRPPADLPGPYRRRWPGGLRRSRRAESCAAHTKERMK